jgi:formylglycine-generating enzyme required for sulfatase activity
MNDNQRVVEITHSKYQPLEVRLLADFGINVKAQRVYELVLSIQQEEVPIPVVFTCNENGAKVFVDNKLVGQIEDNMLTAKIGTGERTIKVSKEGFSVAQRTETITEEDYKFDFELKPAMPAVVKINSSPPGAIVYIDNMKFGITPVQNFFEAGVYPIRIEKENYETIQEKITITEPETQKDYQLTDIRARLTIKTDPAAVVTFQGKECKGGFTDKIIQPQTISFSIRKEFCEPIEKTYTLKKGENKVFELYPEDISSTLTVKTNKKAIIKLKGKKYKGEINNLKLIPQTINIIVEQEFCEPIEKTYTLKKGENKTFELYPQDISARLTVRTHPQATIKFNGKSYKGGVNNLRIEPQVLQVIAEMPKAESVVRVVPLKPQTSETIELYPEVKTGTIIVTVIPTDAEIELIGDAGEHYTAIGRKSFRDVPTGLYQLKVRAENHKTHSEKIRIEENKTIRKQITLEEGSDIPAEMVFVEGGTFQMGSNNGHDNEKPVHSVTVDDFYIGKYEVTQKERQEVMGNNPSNFKGDNRPVEEVSWYNAVEFCNKKSEMEGFEKCYSGSGDNIKCDFTKNGYRLPTEAEWEYAARGGIESDNANYRYAGSNNLAEVAWYEDNSGDKTHPVGKKQPNELGLYDMSGNVWEWCWDWYGNYSSSSHTNNTGLLLKILATPYWYGNYSSSSHTNPRGASSGSYRVARGGSWGGHAGDCRVADRGSGAPDRSSSHIGFRLARSAE